MSFKQFLESRNPETISYTEVKEKGIVTRVIAELNDPAQKGHLTKLARQFENIKAGMDKLAIEHKKRAAELRTLIGDQFDSDVDDMRTRVVETGKMTLTLAKVTKPEEMAEKIEVDYKALADGLSELVAKSLQPQIDELIKACTRKYRPDPREPALRVTQTKESMATAEVDALLEGLTDFFKSLFTKLKQLRHKFDSGMKKLESDMKKFKLIS